LAGTATCCAPFCRSRFPLAAGETPSPELLAAAGAHGGIAPRSAFAFVAALAAAAALALWAQNHESYFSRVAFPDPPVVLASRARQVLERIGYTERAAAAAYGLRAEIDYFPWRLQREPWPATWDGLATLHPPVMTFWYRGSPRPMVAAHYSSTAGTLRPEPSDPPRLLSGMRTSSSIPRDA
jgi:hypothetical protein